MNANEMTFGVEIETIAPESAIRDHGLSIGSYYGMPKQVPYLPPGWSAKGDGSIQTNGHGMACEIVSPILTGEDGLRQVIEVCKSLQDKGHKVNASCGVHVHVGWSRLLPQKALACLVTIVAYVEKGIYAITGTKDREVGRYCRGVRQYGKEKDGQKTIADDRYHVLNLSNLASGQKETVEFRAFSASLNPIKICGWVQICLGLVQKALECKRKPSWNPKPLKGGWAKKGEGASECERLLAYLVWGSYGKHPSHAHAFGWMSDIIPQETVKAEFRRLAKKYDAPQQPSPISTL